MVSQAKIPISLKLTGLSLFIVGFSTLVYLTLAIKTFHEDKKELVFELTQSNVKILASKIEAWLDTQEEKGKVVLANMDNAALAERLVQDDHHLVSLVVFDQAAEQSSKDQTTLIKAGELTNKEFLSSRGISTVDWKRQVESVQSKLAHFDALLLKKKRILFNSSFLSGDQAVYVCTLALLDVQSSKKRILLFTLDPSELSKSLGSSPSMVSTVALDSLGNVLAGETSEQVLNGAQWSRFPELMQDLQKFDLTGMSAVQAKEIKSESESFITGMVQTSNGLVSVVSWVPTKIAFDAANKFIKKTALFLGFIAFLTLFFAIRLAKSLTAPLLDLVVSTQKLSRGEVVETMHLRSQDEVGILANAFNAMAVRISSQRVALERQNQELDIRVKERTEELEAQKRRAAEANDALLKTTRLAALGELAGVTAHEVLNPINNMSIRLEKNSGVSQKRELEDLSLMREILQGWQVAFGKRDWNTFQRELSKPVEGGKILLEEDFANLDLILVDEEKRQRTRQDDLTFLKREMARVTKIVNGMRGLSRVGGEKNRFDVHQAIDDALATVSDLLGKKEITLEKNYSGESRELFMVLGQKEELVQVLSNLLRNSFQTVVEAKATFLKRRGQITVTTSTGVNKRIEIRVSDNGAGVNKENLPKLFETQFTTKTAQDGTGLGLSISRRIVRSFDGDLELDRTQEGVGSTFLIWLPFSVEKSDV